MKTYISKFWRFLPTDHFTALISCVAVVISCVTIVQMNSQTRLTQEQLEIQRRGETSEDRTRLIETLYEAGPKYNRRTRAEAVKEFIQLESQRLARDQKVDLTGALLNQCVLPDLDLRMTVLAQAVFDNAELERANCEGVNLFKGRMVESRFYEGNFKNADLREVNFAGATLTRANLCGADMRGAQIGGANLFKADLSGANMEEAVAGVWIGPESEKGTDLTGAWLKGANMKKCRFSRATLRGADLSGADLSGAVFSDCNLAGADFTGAVLTNFTFTTCDTVGAKGLFKR